MASASEGKSKLKIGMHNHGLCEYIQKELTTQSRIMMHHAQVHTPYKPDLKSKARKLPEATSLHTYQKGLGLWNARNLLPSLFIKSYNIQHLSQHRKQSCFDTLPLAVTPTKSNDTNTMHLLLAEGQPTSFGQPTDTLPKTDTPLIRRT
jgi:hypothetical protein